jgi:dTDP-4-dehydrorhamnose 3,5-epimerase
MRLVDEPLPEVRLLELEPHQDERGFFARAFCRERLARLGVESTIEQANLSLSARRGTLRGMHYQLAPSAETKLVFCMRGALHDVVVDLRPDSPTFGRSIAALLDERNHRVMVVPPGCAHGFLTLADDTVAFYLVSTAYDPARERGIRFDDPFFAISWPFAPRIISVRDRSHPDFAPEPLPAIRPAA